MEMDAQQTAQLRLAVIDSRGVLRQFEFDSFGKQELSIGRTENNNDITIPEGFVSSHHGRILREKDRYYYFDAHSSNGSYVTSASNTRFLQNTNERIELSNHSAIRIGSESDSDRRVLIWCTFMSEGETISRKALDADTVTIGRASSSDIVLPHPSVSRTHAVIRRQSGGYEIADNKSTNGILLNGARLERPTVLQNMDIIQISGFQMIYAGSSIYYRDRIDGIGIIARNVNKFVGSGKGEKQILHEAGVTINANEFVAIIGGSGAGKSTIMNVLNGFDQNYSGDVFYNDINLRDNFQHLKSIIGYVPQDDIIYENLTLQRMLQYTARLRMPGDTGKEEMEARIDEVLQTLDLEEQRDNLIRKMSGGQKKRASIAVELLADPKLFFLDEPTSGLDPGTEKNLMISMKKLCKEQGRTIVMVTHTTQSLHLCDKVVFMGPGGRVCFVGNVEEAKRFFENDDLTEIYNILAEDSAYWERKYSDLQASGETVIQGKKDIGRFRRQKVSPVSQFITLVSRYTELILSDQRKLLILLLEPIVIGLLLYIVAGDHVFDVFNTKHPNDPSKMPIAVDAYNQTKAIMFTLTCAGIWLGLFNSIQEICKERHILRREYMANLRLPIYMASKVIVQIAIGLIQAVLLTMTFLIAMDRFKNNGQVVVRPEELQTLMDNSMSVYTEIILTVWITIVAAMALGLIVSAVVKAGDKAMAVAPFLLIVQLLFSGFLFELEGISEKISYITVSKWSVDSLCRITNLGNIDRDFEDRISDALEDFEWDPAVIIHDWWILILMAAASIIAGTLILRSVAKDTR